MKGSISNTEKFGFQKIKANLECILSLEYCEIENLIRQFDTQIKLVKTDEDIFRILKFREATYEKLLPEVNFKRLEPIDFNSMIFFSEDQYGNIESTSRLVFDSEIGFAEDYVYSPHIQKYRNQDLRLAEWGRCIVSKQSNVRAINGYARLIEKVAIKLGLDYILIFNRESDVPKVLNRLDKTKILCETAITLGGEQNFTAVIWKMNEGNEIYTQDFWNSYARSFMTVTTSIQSELLNHASTYLYGDVIDCGAGCAKISAYLKDNPKVDSYTAIDASQDMCSLGREVLAKVNRLNFSIIHSYIEEYKPKKQYDTAVSINSFYTWPNPEKIINHIYGLLKPEGLLILASINDSIDMTKLAQIVEPDLIMHPDVDKFFSVNIQIEKNKEANLLSLDQMIKLIQKTNFKILKCHNQYYEGGLNFFVLQK